MQEKILSVHDIKMNLSDIVSNVSKGHTFIILRGKKREKFASIVPYGKSVNNTKFRSRKRKLGKAKGKIIIKDDFDELPNDILQPFGIEER
jgi:antitoxin (DNA-binding transcriptional repressor) of toxin-antitoxin stability system